MKLHAFVAMSIVAVASGMTSAAPVPTLNITRLIERSNTVAIGSVFAVASGEPSVVMVNGQQVPGRCPGQQVPGIGGGASGAMHGLSLIHI